MKKKGYAFEYTFTLEELMEYAAGDCEFTESEFEGLAFLEGLCVDNSIDLKLLSPLKKELVKKYPNSLLAERSNEW